MRILLLNHLLEILENFRRQWLRLVNSLLLHDLSHLLTHAELLHTINLSIWLCTRMLLVQTLHQRLNNVEGVGSLWNIWDLMLTSVKHGWTRLLIENRFAKHFHQRGLDWLHLGFLCLIYFLLIFQHRIQVLNLSVKIKLVLFFKFKYNRLN